VAERLPITQPRNSVAVKSYLVGLKNGLGSGFREGRFGFVSTLLLGAHRQPR